ncbi:MAG TPA: Calx-beta domain-containing protein [Thermoleophilaceae bacterium]|jgi:uncharacterized delta-60 repeat protein
MRLTSWTTLTAAAAAFLALSAPALAADGDVDASFGAAGVAHLPFGNSADVAVQPDGKVIAVGDVPGGDTTSYVARLTASGELDPTFSGDGVAIVGAPGGVSARDVAVQPDGKIVVAGIVEPLEDGEGIVFRLTSGGDPDPTFSGDGAAVFDFAAGHSSPTAMQLQPNGRIVVAGSVSAGSASDYGVTRLRTDGSLDTSFAGDGTTTVDVMASDRPRAVALQGDRIVVAGFSEQNAAFSWLAFRLMPDGSRDGSFGLADGLYTTGVFDGLDAVATPGGGVLFGGYDLEGDMAALELDSSGRPDTGFGPGGLRHFDLAARATGVAIAAGGDYALAGTVSPPEGTPRLAVLEVTPQGQPVAGFGDGGKRVFDSIGRFSARDLAVQPDGKLVVGGNDGEGMAAARIVDGTAAPPASEPPPQQSPALPVINLTGGTAVEGQVLVFTATLSRPSDQPVTVSYVTGEGTAATGLDFGGRRGSVTIPPGQTSAPIGIGTNVDRFFEPDESFRVELYDPVGARFGEYVAFGTIVNALRSGRCQNLVRGAGRTDILTGSPAGDLITGRTDIDFLFGLAGDDCVYGEKGDDIIDGGDGDDLVDGGSGDDRIRGGDGDDRLYGRRGINRYDGGPGDDRIYARNGRSEIVECGPGRDVVKADRKDRFRRCERITR